MSFLSSAELTAIRADVANMLPDTCSYEVKTPIADGQGGYTLTSVGGPVTGVACRRDPVNGKELEIGGKITMFYGYMFTLPHNTSITEQAIITHGSDTFEVVALDDGKSWQASVRVYAVKR